MLQNKVYAPLVCYSVRSCILDMNRKLYAQKDERALFGHTM